MFVLHPVYPLHIHNYFPHHYPHQQLNTQTGRWGYSTTIVCKWMGFAIAGKAVCSF